jgi:hypothetical protein
MKQISGEEEEEVEEHPMEKQRALPIVSKQKNPSVLIKRLAMMLLQ